MCFGVVGRAAFFGYTSGMNGSLAALLDLVGELNGDSVIERLESSARGQALLAASTYVVDDDVIVLDVGDGITFLIEC
jgi:hypothetical protein